MIRRGTDDGIDQLHTADLERKIYPHTQTSDDHVKTIHVLHLSTDGQTLQHLLMSRNWKCIIYQMIQLSEHFFSMVFHVMYTDGKCNRRKYLCNYLSQFKNCHLMKRKENMFWTKILYRGYLTLTFDLENWFNVIAYLQSRAIDMLQTNRKSDLQVKGYM